MPNGTVIHEHLRKWREELVDLTRRNRLLYFRHTKSASFEFEQSADEVVGRLERGGRAASWGFHLPPPPPEDADEEYLPPIPAPGQLVVSPKLKRYDAQIERGLKLLAGNTQQQFLDTGLWVLYLGAGMLHWKDPADDKDVLSPLLLVPVRLEPPGGGHAGWTLVESDDGEPALNPALAVKLEKDFGVALPTADDLDDLTPAAVRTAVVAAVEGTGWTVEDTAVLTTFTFQKEVIYRDLLENESEIADHDLVRLLAEGPSSELALEMDFDPEAEEGFDERHPPEELACILDADVSQRQAIVASRVGRSFVVDGPPGTGKSQTIANVVAQLLRDGRTVLFVSEKAAALEVVQNRLTSVGLGEFVLPLHSHTATRKAVAQELGRALTERPRATGRFGQQERARLERDRRSLSGYAVAVNEVRQPLGKTLHDVVGRITELSALPDSPIPSLDLRELAPAELFDLVEVASQLGRAWGPIDRLDDFLWRDLRDPSVGATKDAELRRLVSSAIRAAEGLRDQVNLVHDELRLGGRPTIGEVPTLCALLEMVERRPAVSGGWLAAPGPDEADATAEGLIEQLRKRVSLVELLDETSPAWRGLDPVAWVEWQSAEDSLRKLRPVLELPAGVPVPHLVALADALEEAARVTTDVEDAATLLAERFGISRPVGLGLAERLAELSQLAESSALPEAEWLNPAVKAALDEARSVLNGLLLTYRARREALAEVFTELALEVDLVGLQTRFRDVHKGLGKLSGAYRGDKRALAAVTVSGKVTPATLAQLDEAIEWQRLATDLGRAEAQHGSRLGPYYYATRDTADPDQIDRAISNAERALVLANGDVHSSALAGAVARGAVPDPERSDAATRAAQALDQVRASGLPVQLGQVWDEVTQMPLAAAAVWFADAAAGARAGHHALDGACELLGGATAVGATTTALERRVDYENLTAEITEAVADAEELLGRVVESPAPEELDLALTWVREVRAHLGGRVRLGTATALMRTDLTEPDLRQPAALFEKSLDALLGEFEDSHAATLREELDGEFDASLELLHLLGESAADAHEWAAFVSSRAQLAEAGLEPVVVACEEQRAASGAVAGIVERALLERWAEQVVEGDDRLTPSRAVDRDALLAEFRDLDAALVRNAAADVINACAERRPRSLAGQAGIIRQQAELKRRHKPVRRLMAEAGEAALQLKPCFMMSPLSVSHFLPPGMRFDVVIFDEASQVREADSIGCIYRGDQLIVAGDPKQLPPTSFFERAADDDDDDGDELLDFESILDRCKAQGLRSLPLNWHYRSRHEGLITYSNYSFYEGRLQTFPGATFEAPDLGVELYRVNGEYRRGSTRDNPIEAVAVVDRVVHHRLTHPNLTLGVVTLSVAQQVAVEAEIERRSLSEPVLRELLTDDRLDGFFVKNLENVQGDERDLIIFTIGYGPDENGKLTMNFGPMNRVGGERRLNVAVTRARRRVEVVASLGAGDIRTENPTILHLARYLDYADRGTAALAIDIAEGEQDADSPFEEEVLRSVRSMGFDAVPQVGVAGFRIDIGVRHPSQPGSFALGIECDGATYHSSKVARDRDRLRQDVLEGLGWRIHRIWSTAWFADRPTEERRLADSIAEAISTAQRPRREPEPRLLEPTQVEIEVSIESADFDAPPDWAVPYQEPFLPAAAIGRHEFTDVIARATIVGQISEVVQRFGPIHREAVLRAVRDAWGIGRAGSRIKAAFDGAVASAAARTQLVEVGDFMHWGDQDIAVRVPVDEYDPVRVVREVPPEELDRAIVLLLTDAGTSDFERLRQTWARLFGWRRVGIDIEVAFEEAVDRLLRAGEIDGPDPLRLPR